MQRSHVHLVSTLLFCVLCGYSDSAQTTTNSKTHNVPACTTQQEPGFMTSWSGQPGHPDHSESRSVDKGDLFACHAYAGSSSVPSACFLSYENDGHYTLPHQNGMRSPSSDIMTLTCNGQSPTCCRLQVSHDPHPLSKKDLKKIESFEKK